MGSAVAFYTRRTSSVVELVPCKQRVIGSIPLLSTKSQNHALLRLSEIIQRSAIELAFSFFAPANQP